MQGLQSLRNDSSRLWNLICRAAAAQPTHDSGNDIPRIRYGNLPYLECTQINAVLSICSAFRRRSSFSQIRPNTTLFVPAQALSP